jgi:hypothetical protein
VFLLGHAATLKERRSVDDWVNAAGQRSTYMSRALGLGKIAGDLLDSGLATFQERIVVANALSGLAEQADATTLRGIARLLLKASPPSWLRLAVQDGHLCREYIPADDLDSLAWIEPELDEALLGANEGSSAPEDDGFLKALGDAAELLVLEGLRWSGASPVHVARMSDAFGYDIEVKGPPLDRVEVKASSRLTSTSFHLSRNEFEMSVRYGNEWRLVQVVFSTKAFVADCIDASMVECIREFRPGALRELVPPDTATFTWTKSAKVTPPDCAWMPSMIVLNPRFSIPGFTKHSSECRLRAFGA